MNVQSVSPALRKEALMALAEHGKTFYWASFFLSKNRAALAALLYSCCRQLDDIADDPGFGQEHKRSVLSQINDEISQSESPVRYQVSAAWRQLTQSGIDAAAVSGLIEGLIQDTDPLCFDQQRELDRYSYRVAGTVGIMMCSVLNVRDCEALPFAIDLGIAMQLTNICRDVLEDAGLGRRYLPVNVSIETLLAAPQEVHQPVIESIEAQLDNAEQFYESALQGLIYLPRGSRVAIYLAATLYRAIGHKLRSGKCAWWKGRIFLSAGEKLLTTLRAAPFMIYLFLASGPKPGVKHRHALHRHLDGLPYADF